MATTPIGIDLSNATIDLDAMTITEYPKKNGGEIKVYNLTKLLIDFEGIEGISFSIKGKSEVEPDEIRYSEGD